MYVHSDRDLITASVMGYETGVRVGTFLGRSHYKVFHTTGTAGTQAAGLLEFLRDAADSKQLHTAKAAPTPYLRRCMRTA
jgi:2-methylcitrate dehydratase PrpD